MKIVNDIVSDLVEKKLWPVALGLIAAIALVPMWLASPGEPPAPEPGPPANIAQESGPSLTLTRASKTGFDRAPRVNKQELDPFAERNDKKADAAMKKLREKIEEAIKGALGGSGGGDFVPSDPGTGGGVTPNPPADDEPVTDNVKEEEDDLLSILVTVGDGAPTQIDDIRTLLPLPDATKPFLVYTGKTSTGAAVFLVDVDAQPSGAGNCDPSPSDCRTITLAEGDTADFKLSTGETVSITVISVETGKVKVTAEGARAARLEAQARRVGATALKSALDDPTILESLHDRKVRFR